MAFRILLIVALIGLASPCNAGEVEADSTRNPAGSLLQNMPAPDMPHTYGLIARMAFSLIIVIGLIWGVVLLLRRISGKRVSGAAKSFIKVLERSYIAPKKAVYVIQVGNRTLAVGVTDAQMTTLAELDPEETLAAYPAFQKGSPPFAHLLKDMRTRFLGRETPGEMP